MDPYLEFIPPLVYSMPIQLLLQGTTLTLLTLLTLHLAFTAPYHLPISSTNYYLLTTATVTSLLATALAIAITANALTTIAKDWPYMYNIVEIIIPPTDWSRPYQIAWDTTQFLVILSLNATHIQFLTILFPSPLEYTLIVILLGNSLSPPPEPTLMQYVKRSSRDHFRQFIIRQSFPLSQYRRSRRRDSQHVSLYPHSPLHPCPPPLGTRL